MVGRDDIGPAGVPPAIELPGRLVETADFQRVLRAPLRCRSPHFAVHYLEARPARRRQPVVPELSTGGAPTTGISVDDSPRELWLGAVVPKRHARRAVTRSLLKRQIRKAVARHAGRLPRGLWVVRLRAPFDTKQFPSAASTALKQAVRTELDAVLGRAAD
jgi:ribonuclease P protein component